MMKLVASEVTRWVGVVKRAGPVEPASR